MLSKAVKELREARGWSQAELGRRAGVTQQLIAKIENGGAKESRKLPSIAAALGVAVEELVGRMHGIGSSRLGRDPHLERLLECWPELSITAKEHVVQAAEFARAQSAAPFRRSVERHAVHEPKSTYSPASGRRVRRQGQ